MERLQEPMNALRDLNADYEGRLQRGRGDPDEMEAVCFKGFESARRGLEDFNRSDANLRTHDFASTILAIYLKGVVDWAERIADCFGSASSVENIPPDRLVKRLSQIDICAAFVLSLKNDSGQHGMYLLGPEAKANIGNDLAASLHRLYNAKTWMFAAQLIRLFESASPHRRPLLYPMYMRAIESRLAFERLVDALNEAKHGDARSTQRVLQESERAWDELVKLGIEFDRFSDVYEGRNEGDDLESAADPVMGFVNFLRDYACSRSDALDFISARISELEESITDEQWASNVSASGGDAKSEASSKAAERRKNKEKSIVPGAGARSGTAAPLEKHPQRPDHKAVLRNELLLRADKALRPTQLTTPLVREISDPLELATRLGRDTAYLTEMERRRDCDPLLVVQKLRMRSPRWFGSIEAVGRAIRSLESFSSLSKSNEIDTEISARIDALRDRIQTLEIINRELDAREANALKMCQFPKGQDLKRLMELDDVSVSAVRKLPSHDDESGEKGKLFEIEIRPSGVRPDGRGYNPLYLHMHAKQQVTVNECLDLRFNDLAAVHVKNLEQRGKGATWEKLQQGYGNQHVSVHRGPVDRELLGTLLRKARSASGATAASTSQ